jgi:transposase
MVSLACFIPLFLVDNYKDKSNLKIIALLLPFFLFGLDIGYTSEIELLAMDYSIQLPIHNFYAQIPHNQHFIFKFPSFL